MPLSSGIKVFYFAAAVHSLTTYATCDNDSRAIVIGYTCIYFSKLTLRMDYEGDHSKSFTIIDTDMFISFGMTLLSTAAVSINNVTVKQLVQAKRELILTLVSMLAFQVLSNA